MVFTHRLSVIFKLHDFSLTFLGDLREKLSAVLKPYTSQIHVHFIVFTKSVKYHYMHQRLFAFQQYIKSLADTANTLTLFFIKKLQPECGLRFVAQ